MGKQILNGIVYGTGEIIKFSPEIYSLEEREIGVWTDGKPLYQKTITFQSSNSAYSMSVPHGISNLDKVINYFGCIKETSITRFVPQHYTRANASDYYIYDVSVYNVSQKGIFIVYDDWLKTNPQIIDLTIQYTKTTDAPGSGKWTTQGTLAHHYSTEEQVIGTWIDGKPLYEKTFYCASLPNNSNIQIPTGYTELNTVNLFGIATAVFSTGKQSITLPSVSTANNNVSLRTDYNGEYIVIGTQSERDMFSAYITLQYTKTTDTAQNT